MQRESSERGRKEISPQTAVRLRTLRAENGLTQAEVARRLGISQQTYSKYENSDAAIDSEVLRKLCALYGVSADYILAIEHAQQESSASVKGFTVEDEQIELIVHKVLSQMDKNKNQ